MTPDQRKALVQKFEGTKVKSAMFSVLSSESDYLDVVILTRRVALSLSLHHKE